MFGLVESLQGPSAAAVDSDDESSAQASSSTSKQQVPADAGAERFSLWGMATALAENVKKSTAEIAARCGYGLHHHSTINCLGPAVLPTSLSGTSGCLCNTMRRVVVPVPADTLVGVQQREVQM